MDLDGQGRQGLELDKGSVNSASGRTRRVEARIWGRRLEAAVGVEVGCMCKSVYTVMSRRRLGGCGGLGAQLDRFDGIGGTTRMDLDGQRHQGLKLDRGGENSAIGRRGLECMFGDEGWRGGGVGRGGSRLGVKADFFRERTRVV